MCHSPEKQQRQLCASDLKAFKMAFEPYLEKHGTYPAALQTEDFPGKEFRDWFRRSRGYLFPGANRRPDGARFIVIEDAPRAHAGGLRHRLWSDGATDHIHSWKTAEQ